MTPAYAIRIDDLVRTYITERDPRSYIVPLLSALGCRHLAEDDRGDWEACTPLQPPEIEEPVIASTLLLALGAHMRLVGSRKSTLTIEDEGVAILDGLSRHNRWRACLNDPRAAYDLASVLMLGEDKNETTSVAKLASEVRPAAVEMLNAWVMPAVSFNVMPSSREVAEALFGGPWCAFALDSEDLSDEVIVEAFRTDRPPFRQGLVLGVTAAEAVSLPVLDVGP